MGHERTENCLMSEAIMPHTVRLIEGQGQIPFNLYKQLQADFKTNNMLLKMDIVCGRCSVNQINQFRRCIFSNNINTFCYLELEIVLAIPAPNDKKYNLNNLAGHGLFFDPSFTQKYPKFWTKL